MSEQIQPAYREKMNALAAALDDMLNGKERPKKVGFVLLVYEFGKMDHGRVNYIGNGARDDVRVALTELLARWEGRYSETEARQ